MTRTAHLAISVALIVCPAWGTDFQTPFNNLLRSKGYVPMETYKNDPVLGHLAISCSGSDFDPNNWSAYPSPVPAGTFSQPTPGVAIIPAGEAKFGLSALLSGIASLAQGALGVSFTTNKDINLQQINATSLTLDNPAQVFSSKYYQELLKSAVPTGCKAYFIARVLTTTSISFTTSTQLSGSVSFGSTGTCKIAGSDSGASGGSGLSKNAAHLKANLKAKAASKGTDSASGNSSTPESTGIGGSLCLTSSNQLTLNAKDPVTFAVVVYTISGTTLGPQLTTVHSGVNVRGKF